MERDDIPQVVALRRQAFTRSERAGPGAHLVYRDARFRVYRL